VSAEVAVPRMLVLARESRGLTQGELAEVMTEQAGAVQPVSQGYVSRAEAGRLVVSGERLDAFAQALRYPRDLLCVSEPETGAGPGLVHHRKKQSVSAADLRRILAVLNLSVLQLEALSVADRSPGDAIPHIPVDHYDSPEDAARAVRAKWEVPAGPVGSLVGLLEAAGAVVISRDLVDSVPLDSGAETVPVDAVSSRPVGRDPLIVLNTGTPPERQRFTLAHELGHLVMHQVPDPRQEQQADRFAAELLMPRRDILPDLQATIDIPRLLNLKESWRVSMWALLRRAHTLGTVSDWQYRKLAVELSSLGYRTREPDPLPPEAPATVARLVAAHRRAGRSVADLARLTHLLEDEFVHLYIDEDTEDRSAAASASAPPQPRPPGGRATDSPRRQP
jgi:Zn-dependent peptidase ImmA (M78 family)